MINRILSTLFLLAAMLLPSCTVKTGGPNVLPPQESFAYIQIHTEMRACDLNIGQCAEQDGYGMASGVLVDKSKEDDVAHILTAEHVCVPHPRGVPSNISVNEIHNELVAVTIEGKEHPAKILAIDERYDLCLLQIDYVEHPVVTIAHEQPAHEERVYNLAAPKGIWAPGAVMLLEGRYDGDIGKDALYTLPAAPGSSGSPIFNTRGELVGILHSVAIDFNVASFASRLSDIRRFLSDEL